MPNRPGLPTHGFTRESDGFKHILDYETACQAVQESLCGKVLDGGCFNSMFPDISLCPECKTAWEDGTA